MYLAVYIVLKCHLISTVSICNIFLLFIFFFDTPISLFYFISLLYHYSLLNFVKSNDTDFSFAADKYLAVVRQMDTSGESLMMAVMLAMMEKMKHRQKSQGNVWQPIIL